MPQNRGGTRVEKGAQGGRGDPLGGGGGAPGRRNLPLIEGELRTVRGLP